LLTTRHSSSIARNGGRPRPSLRSIQGDDQRRIERQHKDHNGDQIDDPADIGSVGGGTTGNLRSSFSRKRALAQTREGLGLGLGLFIVDQIVSAHGGTITVASSQEEGTIFFVRLPRRLPS
jgi:nitrogen-specific signal transduction histidine kinase